MSVGHRSFRFDLFQFMVATLLPWRITDQGYLCFVAFGYENMKRHKFMEPKNTRTGN